MIRLSVNVNKVATLRNSRGGRMPRVLEAVGVCRRRRRAGHHRAPARRPTPHHARRRARHRPRCCAHCRRRSSSTSKAIRGPTCSIWSTRSAPISARSCRSRPARSRARPAGRPARSATGFPRSSDASRRSAFASACSSTATPDPIRWAASAGADRVELYTEPFARAFERGPEAARRSFAHYADAARLAHALGLGVNAGHDLDLDNLVLFRDLPHLDEVSIGHALMSRALFVGLARSCASTCDSPRDDDADLIRELGLSMKSDSIAFGIAGIVFGLIAGWIIGTQQATVRPPCRGASGVGRARRGRCSLAPPSSTRRRSTRSKSVAEREAANPTPRVELGNLYFDAERYDDAIKWYDAALKLTPNDVNVSTDLGVSYYYTNQPDKALEQFDQSLKIDPKHAKTLLNIGIVKAFGKQDLEGASKAWQQVIQLAPDSPEGQAAKRALDTFQSAHPAIGGTTQKPGA